MKIRLIRNALIAVFFGISVMNVPYQLQADSADYCSKEVLLAYFPESFVLETLKTFKIPQDQWSAITKDLSEQEKNVVKLVDEKASKLNPNPLKDRSPESRQETVKIFRETILEIFGNVLKAHGINDEKQIKSMLIDVQQQKAKNFAKCMEKQRSLFDKNKSSSTPNASPDETESKNTPLEDSSSTQNKPQHLADSDKDQTKPSTENKEDESENKENESDKEQKDNQSHTNDQNQDSDQK